MIAVNEQRGLEASLREYSKLCLPQGQSDFYQTDNKVVVREMLGRFLADAEENQDGNSVHFSQVVGGKERASRSRPVGTRKIPITELEAFEEAIQSFLQKAEAAGTAPRAKEIITHLRLPDPELEPDMYRLYGPPWNRRLLALWGCERRQASSLPPLEAVKKLGRRVKPLWQIWLERALWLLLLLVILVGVALVAGRGCPGCKKGSSVQVKEINTPPTPATNGMVVSSSQYLVVTVDPATMELPSKVTARVKFPGEVDFHQQYKTNLVEGQSNTYTGFDKAGNYRIEWQPDANSNNIHGEFVRIALLQYAGQSNQLIANLQLVPKSATTGQVVHADATASAPGDPAAPVSKIEIDWDGKGQLVALDRKSENHVFSAAGKYPILLRVTDKRGRTATDTAVAYVDDGTGSVVPPTNRPPIAKLRLVSVDTNQLSATIADGGSVDPDGQIVSWALDWGDNTPEGLFTAAPQNESHSFAAAGEYWVSLTCVDNLQAPGHEPAKVKVALFSGKKDDGKKDDGKKDGGKYQGGRVPFIHLGLGAEVRADEGVSFVAQVESFDFPVSLHVDFGDKSAPGQLTIGAAYHGDKRVETGRFVHPYPPEQDYVVRAVATDRDGHSDERMVVIKAIGARDFEIVKTATESQADKRAKVSLLVRDKKNNNATDFVVMYWIVDGVKTSRMERDFTPDPLVIGDHLVYAAVQVGSGAVWEYCCMVTIPQQLVPQPGEPKVQQRPKRRP
jgi:hypothetical protein